MVYSAVSASLWLSVVPSFGTAAVSAPFSACAASSTLTSLTLGFKLCGFGYGYGVFSYVSFTLVISIICGSATSASLWLSALVLSVVSALVISLSAFATHLPEYAFTRVRIYQSTHLPEYAFTRVRIYQSTHLPEYAFTRVRIYQSTHLPEYAFTSSLHF